MSLKEQLQTDLKAAMRDGDKPKRDTLRMVMAAIKQEEVDNRITLDDDGVLAILTRQVKQRRESIADYEKAGKLDDVAQEKYEMDLIETYLPQMMSEAEIEPIVAQIIAELGVTDVKGMGQVMGKAMAALQGKADGRLVNQIVRQKLQG
ncbi:MAG: GatB/YqeY domain-containing protein [Ardenticatenaceae bacterium]|nr:GatB/YqeY domain-containing protein [Ardenticatenaceae bacterium]